MTMRYSALILLAIIALLSGCDNNERTVTSGGTTENTVYTYDR
jgi:hypothetical protein